MTQPAANAPAESFEQFRQSMLAQGYDEVLERTWEPDTVIDTHTHPFEANAVISRGEMFLAVQGQAERRLLPGDRFHLLPNVPHAERYGAQGATYWVARKA
ncbi:AraC family transcriptional regulator [Herbaspirillum sp. LeCh32-8]|uniref:AraC family transcriptional regulator n=1 Tax=Herbaspirillum sp. LeCh32-8 TaxID=2821356 RepID=UPI001AE7E620|nr:AraC family transcriptional regulator [Herbaspirillum sp. LeCh32-8]MBP0599792.1 AraC family transcriptional regulator [Herbaspirillum sp. LeCh32-8]